MKLAMAHFVATLRVVCDMGAGGGPRRARTKRNTR